MRQVETEYIRYSMLATAADCGELYRRLYRNGEAKTDDHSVPTLVGSALHAACEDYENVVRTTRQDETWWTDEVAADLSLAAKKHILHIIEEGDLDVDGLEFWGKQDLKQFRTKLLPQMALNYVRQRQQEARNGWRAYEFEDGMSPFEVNVWTPMLGGKFYMRGQVDRVMVDNVGRIVISDLKSGKRKDSHAVQLEVYRAGLSRQYGIDADYGQVLYVKGSDAKPELVKQWQYDNDTVEQMMSRLYWMASAGTAVTGPFNGHCQVCEIADTCKFKNLGLQGSS